MKKILIVLNESYIPRQAIKKALHIAKESNSLLEAIFINDTDTISLGYPFPNDLYLINDKVRGSARTEESMKLLNSMAQEFKDECEEQGVEYKIEIDKAVSIKHLLELSCFADLIIADSKANSDEYDLKDLLTDAHCPLLLISKNAEPVEKIFVAYDGSPSGMYALKMFSYLFPEYKNYPVNFFQVSAGHTDEIKNLTEIKTWAGLHFSNIKFEMIKGDTKNELVGHIRQGSEKIILVMGAYGGSSLKRLLLKSTAEAVISETNASLFITHQ